MEQQFSRRQMELILRRTAELERGDEDALDEVSAGDLERVAADLGMSQTALRQAMAETRAGLLADPGERGALDRVFGERFLEIKRHVPGTPAQVRAAVERYLAQQGFVLRRNRGTVTVWESASDLWTWLSRPFRAGQYRLPRDLEIEVSILELTGGEHPVMVRLRVDARRLRSSRVGAAAVAVAAGVGIAVTGAALLSLPTELALWGTGAAVGAGGTALGRSSFRSARERVATALERFLDLLEHPPAAPAPRKDPVQRIVDFFSR